MATTPETENKPEVKPEEKPTAAPEDAGFKALKEQRDSLKSTLKSQAAELEQLRALKAEHDKAAKEKSDKELAAKGEYEKIIENNRKEAELKQNTLINKMAINAIPILIKGAASKVANIAPGAMTDLPDMLDKYLALDADNFTVKVLNPDGTPMLDQKTGKAMDPDEFIQGFIKDRPYLLSDTLPVKHGLIPPNKGPGKAKGIMEMSREETHAVIGTEVDSHGNPRVVDAAAAEAYNEALAAEFTSANMYTRSRALLREKGILKH